MYNSILILFIIKIRSMFILNYRKRPTAQVLLERLRNYEKNHSNVLDVKEPLLVRYLYHLYLYYYYCYY